MNRAATQTSKGAVAVAALAGVDAASAGILHECFRQFGIETLAIAAQDTAHLGRQRFDACVLPLDERAPQVLSAIRHFPGNSHAVLYGICGGVQEALRLSGYAINALFLHPVERQAALQVVRSTHLLVLHELRRYVRVPLVVAATLRTERESAAASTVELSSGGVALHTRAPITVAQTVQVALQLPHLSQLSPRAVVCWVRPEEELAGLRFEPGDPGRAQLRQWLDDYLGEA